MTYFSIYIQFVFAHLTIHAGWKIKMHFREHQMQQDTSKLHELTN